MREVGCFLRAGHILSSSIVVVFFVVFLLLLFCFFSIGITCIIYSYLFHCLDCGIAMVLVDSAVNYYSLVICQYSAKESH